MWYIGTVTINGQQRQGFSSEVNHIYNHTFTFEMVYLLKKSMEILITMPVTKCEKWRGVCNGIDQG